MADRNAKSKLWVKRAAFSLIPVAVLFIGAEVLATLAIRREVRTFTDSASGQTVYTMRIGRFPWSRRSTTPLNSQGFPDVEFNQVPPKDGCLHMIFIGDSFVFGDGVDLDSSFVSVIRRRIPERSAVCVRVFNLGERGTSIHRQAETLRGAALLLEPDIVVLGQYQNDLTDLALQPQPATVDAAQRGWTSVRERFASFNLNVVRFVSYHAFGSAIRRDVTWDLLSHWSVLADTTRRETAQRLMREYEEAFESLATDLEARAVAFGVVIIPSKFDVLGGRFPEEDFFVRLARRHSVPYLRTFSVLDEQRAPYAFLMYDGHLNEHGNRLFADAILDWLFDSVPPPFPVLRTAHDIGGERTGTGQLPR